MISGYEMVSREVFIFVSLITNNTGFFHMHVGYFFDRMSIPAMFPWNWNRAGATEPFWTPMPSSQLVQDPEGK